MADPSLPFFSPIAPAAVGTGLRLALAGRAGAGADAGGEPSAAGIEARGRGEGGTAQRRRGGRTRPKVGRFHRLLCLESWTTTM